MGLERRRCGGCNGVSGSSTVRRETIDLMEVEGMWANLKRHNYLFSISSESIKILPWPLA